jgi:transketolase
MAENKYSSFKSKAREIRYQLLKMLYEKKAGHIPSCYSMIDILTVLFYAPHIRFEIRNPYFPARDKIIISKGHAAMALYPIFAELGYFSAEELGKFTQPGGLLGLYADYRVPGIEGISGSLGHGIGMASGFALSDLMDEQERNIFVVIGDGECYEGSIWEAAIFAAHHNLDRLTVILDRNKLCILGKTEELVKLGALEAKWAAFGWNVISVNGHDYKALDLAFVESINFKGKPTIIIADTIKGKGISFMEGNASWHNKMPTEELFKKAFSELT